MLLSTLLGVSAGLAVAGGENISIPGHVSVLIIS
jgi:hypothetical protein